MHLSIEEDADDGAGDEARGRKRGGAAGSGAALTVTSSTAKVHWWRLQRDPVEREEDAADDENATCKREMKAEAIKRRLKRRAALLPPSFLY